MDKPQNRRNEMSNSLFTLILGLALLPLLLWAYTVLPRERWQIIAAIPTRKAAVPKSTR